MSTDLAEETDQPAAPEPDGKKKGRLRARLRRAFTYDFAGIAVAFFFAWLSFTPSLIPRSALFQGLVAGVAGVMGYVVGLGIRWVVVQFTDRRPTTATWRRLWIGLWIVGLIGTIIAIALGEMWQTELRDLMGLTDQALPAYGLVGVARRRGLRPVHRNRPCRARHLPLGDAHAPEDPAGEDRQRLGLRGRRVRDHRVG